MGTSSLKLNVRAKTLTGTLGGNPINLIVQPGGGLLAQVKPGRYVIGKPLNDPTAGWIAPVEPLGGISGRQTPRTKGGNVEFKWKVESGEEVGVPGPAGFALSTRSTGGWNEVVVANGDRLMADLQRQSHVELQVV